MESTECASLVRRGGNWAVFSKISQKHDYLEFLTSTTTPEEKKKKEETGHYASESYDL